MPDQIRVSNGRLSIGLSRRTGAWVELVCEATGENLVKNRRDAAMTPLQVFLGHRAEPVGPSEADAPAWDMDRQIGRPARPPPAIPACMPEASGCPCPRRSPTPWTRAFPA